ncbi:hypothetical protein K435DRAFT_794610 [Dendrothele bispora CBS 962.96]|uniref:Uncharacterized protein n=1 Tax=Dendrothele bispora (strain CBS 962.96) TaxID=1314807 RepID=A0A4V4HGQ3_DENBC|nr:hypothetical protein K435DRAFT_794610 [Dendrothele bispora CBS 962.96]
MLRMLVVARNTNQNATLSRAMSKLPEERQSFREEGGGTGNKDPVGPIRPWSSLPDLLFGLNYLRATMTVTMILSSSTVTSSGISMQGSGLVLEIVMLNDPGEDSCSCQPFS